MVVGLTCLSLSIYLLLSIFRSDSRGDLSFELQPNSRQSLQPPQHVVGPQGEENDDDAEQHAQRMEEVRQDQQRRARDREKPTPKLDDPQPVRPRQTKERDKDVAVALRPPLVPSVVKVVKAAPPSPPPPIPIVIFTFDRAANLRRTVESVLSRLPAAASSAAAAAAAHPIIISQDGDHPAVEEVIKSYGARVRHLRFRWLGKPQPPHPTAYLKIAAHYQFALSAVFDNSSSSGRQQPQYDRVILLEDDMELAPDFFPYFRRLSPLLDSDSSLLCVSAWNDNGQARFTADTRQLLRTECFPGLGWMMSRKLWTELRAWTWGYWDDWLREPQQRKGRSCIIPEVNRVFTFGSVGTSAGQFYEQYLKGIRLNEDSVDWQQEDVDWLQQDNYDQWMQRMIQEAVSTRDVNEAIKQIEDELKLSKSDKVKERKTTYQDLQHLTSIISQAQLTQGSRPSRPLAVFPAH